MQLYGIEISEKAAQDLENIGDYIARKLKNPSAAVNTIRGIRKKINTLCRFPERHELDEDDYLAELSVRKVYYRNYKVYYVIEGRMVFVVRILHKLEDKYLAFYVLK